MKRRNAIAWCALTILFAVVIAMVAITNQGVKTAGDDIPIARVKQGDLDLKVFSIGELRAQNAMMLTAPPVGGGALQIIHLLHTGTPVKKGDVVFEFDPSEQQYKLEQNRSELLQAEQEMVKTRADAEVQAAQDKVALLKARFEVRRAELEVQKNELVSAIDARKNQLILEQARKSLAKLEHDMASHTASGQATISVAQEKRHKARLAMEQASQNIEKMRVTAPMDGLVALEKNHGSMGEMMWSGMSIPDFRAGDQVQPGSAVAQVIDPSQMQVTAKVGEHERSNIKLGQAVEIIFDALPGQSFRGTVKTLGGMSMRQFWETDIGGKFEISILLNGADSRLRPGITAQIVVLGEPKKGAFYVPRQAIFLKDGKTIVYKHSGTGFEPQQIKVQCESESRAAIQGLMADDEIALIDPTAPKKTGNLGPSPGAGGGLP